jgi:hypothetical protein
LLEGTISKDWGEHQHRFYTFTNKQNSGHRWLVELIKKLWKIAWDIWEYRNGVACTHNTNATTLKLNLQIQTLLSQGGLMNSTLQPHLLSASITATLPTSTNSTKRSWITAMAANKTYFSTNKKRRIEILSMQRNMRSFLNK